jgi:hypothetical protein
MYWTVEPKERYYECFRSKVGRWQTSEKSVQCHEDGNQCESSVIRTSALPRRTAEERDLCCFSRHQNQLPIMRSAVDRLPIHFQVHMFTRYLNLTISITQLTESSFDSTGGSQSKKTQYILLIRSLFNDAGSISKYIASND